MTNPLLIPTAGGLAIVVLLGLLLVLRRRTRRLPTEEQAGLDEQHADVDLDDLDLHDADLDDTDPDDTDLVPMVTYTDEAYRADEAYEADGDDELHTWETEVPPGPEPVNVRYLRAQVRTLQETLEQVQDVPDHGGADMGRFRRQVTAALRGLGERTREDESPERTLARVVAAIERLDAPDTVARPVLPTVKFDLSGAQMTLAGPQYVAAPAALSQAPIITVPAPRLVPAMAGAPEAAPDVAPEVAQAAPAPDPEPAPEPAAAATGVRSVTTPLASALAAASYEDDLHDRTTARAHGADPFGQDEEVLAPPPDPDVVLPVPPPAALTDQRSRRWSRRHGA